MRFNKAFILFFGFIIIWSCNRKEGSLFSHPNASKTGVTFKNTLTSTDDLSILDYLYFYNGGGVAVGDINNDGLPDIYLSGNQTKNKLYLNKGNLQFEDITENAGVAGNSEWNTGTVMADVNGDGFLDIYVCAVVGINGFNGFNELFINNGDGTFSEQAAKYGLDLDTYSSNAAFFDYDLDGDLDMYLLNHAVHTENSFGRVNLRYERNYETGDRLLKNDNGKYIDISEEAGIYGGINGYGLGLSVADFNNDGYPDIYVGNDFHEDDYFYVNNGDGTFSERLKEHFGHTTRFSMGNDVADINHDGLPDLISLDMLPEEEVPLKASEGDDNIQTQRIRTEQYGYHYQFTRNMLFVNQQDGKFLETALASGVAATDWSWSALFADFDQDGEQDLFISNGIPKRPNDLDFIKFVSSDEILKKIDNTKLVDDKALSLMPSGTSHNYVFKGNGKLSFKDLSDEWITKDTLISGATAYADFDLDGDLDLITNNLNQEAKFYINQTNNGNNYIKLKFNYTGKNSHGIGTKVYAYASGKLFYKELQPSRGFQASSEPIIHFGFGKEEIIDSLKIVWPNNQFQLLTQVKTNQNLTIKPEDTKPHKNHASTSSKKLLFLKSEEKLGLDITHKEDNYVHFNREKLIPFQISDRGPAVAFEDINNDGKKDLFVGGSKFIANQIYIQQDSSFIKKNIPFIDKDSIKEVTSLAIFDTNGDSKKDIILGSGGADFFGKAEALTESYFEASDTSFTKKSFPKIFENSSVIIPYDFDQDGDEDVFVGRQSITAFYGKKPTSQLLENTNGEFTPVQADIFAELGMVTDAVWSDFDGDNQKDLIIVGEWMQPFFFKNNKGKLTLVSSPEISGLWQKIAPFDIDGDGDTDYLLGNWGTNSKFKASKDSPMKMYVSDFDTNGTSETIVTIKKNNKEYTLATLDDLAGQMVSLRKKFTNYSSFAGKTVFEVFDETQLKKATILEVNTLESGYLKNMNGEFTFIPFALELQLAPILEFSIFDFDKDGDLEALAAGNYFGIKPYHGRFDSFPGALITNENEVFLGSKIGLDFTQKSIRKLQVFDFNGKSYLLAVFNNEKAQLYQINN